MAHRFAGCVCVCVCVLFDFGVRTRVHVAAWASLTILSSNSSCSVPSCSPITRARAPMSCWVATLAWYPIFGGSPCTPLHFAEPPEHNLSGLLLCVHSSLMWRGQMRRSCFAVLVYLPPRVIPGQCEPVLSDCLASPPSRCVTGSPVLSTQPCSPRAASGRRSHGFGD